MYRKEAPPALLWPLAPIFDIMSAESRPRGPFPLLYYTVEWNILHVGPSMMIWTHSLLLSVCMCGESALGVNVDVVACVRVFAATIRALSGWFGGLHIDS